LEIDGLITLWKRELRGYFREKSQVLGAVFTAMLWLVIFGIGISSMRFGRVSPEYKQFIFPGIIGMAILIVGIRSGFSILRDRETGFLRLILVSPLSQITIVTGKIFGGSSVATLQGMIVLLLGFMVDINITPLILILALPIMFLLSIGLVAMGLIIASFMDGFEGFNLVMSMLFLPMFFLSGALFPLNALPDWLVLAAYINPLTYGVDALRGVILGAPELAISWDIAILTVFSSLMLLLSALTFDREFN